jgi:hypothetical protein|tara:strand:- start:686 stop:1342 length:657 start_codon:yes stop_codon:yes gene_type:complete
MIKNVILVGAVGALLSACASNTGTIDTAKKPTPFAVKKAYEHTAKVVEEQVEQVPDWYTKMPDNKDAIYSVGTALSPELQLSKDIAILSAKTILADRINGRLNSVTKSFMTKVGSSDLDASVINEISTATKNIVADVDVAGYKVKESKIVSNGMQYRVYVLLEYSDEEAQKILLNRLKKDKMLMSKIKANQAFKELDADVNKVKESETDKLNKIIDAG